MTTPTREQVSKLFKGALNKRREMPEESKGDIARWLFSEGMAVARADLEATIEQLRAELDGEKAAALNYRADAIKAEKQRDDANARAAEMEQRYDQLTLDLKRIVEQRDELMNVANAIYDIRELDSNDVPLEEAWPELFSDLKLCIASAKGVQQDNLRSFSLRLDREEWGHVIDGLILERERSLLRKSENSESNSNEISDCCAKLIGRINRACAISTLSETPIASVEGGAA